MKQTEGSEGVRAYDMVLTQSQLCLSEFAFLVPTHAQGFCVGTGPIWQAFSQDPRKKYHHFLICHISQCPLRPSLSKGACISTLTVLSHQSILSSRTVR